MNTFFVNLFGDTIGPAIGVIVAVIIVVLLLGLLWTLSKRVRSGLFVAGGRDRRPRLSVIDATPVDSKRRLVLVRCDDDEHLIMIGGPNDLVIYSNAAEAIQEKQRPAQNMPSAEELARMAADEAQRSRRTRKTEQEQNFIPLQVETPPSAISEKVTAPVAAVGAALAGASTARASDASTIIQEQTSTARDAAIARLQAAAQRPHATPSPEPEAPHWNERKFDDTPQKLDAGPTAQPENPSIDDEMDQLLSELQLNEQPQR